MGWVAIVIILFIISLIVTALGFLKEILGILFSKAVNGLGNIFLGYQKVILLL